MGLTWVLSQAKTRARCFLDYESQRPAAAPSERRAPQLCYDARYDAQVWTHSSLTSSQSARRAQTTRGAIAPRGQRFRLLAPYGSLVAVRAPFPLSKRGAQSSRLHRLQVRYRANPRHLRAEP